MLVVMLAACGGGEEAAGGRTGGTGKTVFALSDAAADMGSVSSIYLTIDSVRVHTEGGAWATVSSNTQTYDLLELRAKGTAKLLAQADLQANTYDQVELGVSKVVVVDNKGEHEAKLPSNKLQIKGELDVTADHTATANFDFLADQSLHITGEGRYILSPVINVETRADAQAQVQSDNEVKISGGSTKTEAQVGMDIEGNIDSGLRITPDALLSIAASGKIVQTKGQALVVGTIKAVDSANGTVTLTTKGGTDLVLHVANNSEIKAKGAATALVNLTAHIGTEAIARYNTETKAMAALAANADSKAKAEIGAKIELNGTIKSVNTAAGTVTVTADSGADVILKVGSDAQLQVDGAVINLLGLGAKIGSRVEAELNTTTGTVGSLEAHGESKATASGTIKAVNPAQGTVTITTASNQDVVLNVTSVSSIVIDGTISSLATLAGKIGAQVSAEYNAKTNTATSVNAQGQGQAQATVSGTLKSANAAAGTITVTTQSGTDVVLNVASDAKLLVNGSASTLAAMATKIGSQVTAEYNAQTKVATSVSTQGQAGASLTASGTLKAVDTTAGTITVTGQNGSDIVLKVSSDTKIEAEGTVVALATLATKIGAQVTAEYNSQTKTATSVAAQAQAKVSATITGTLKAVSIVFNTVTITTQDGAELVLNVTSQSKVQFNASAALLAVVAAKVGSPVTVEYDTQTKAVISMNVKG